MSPILELWSTRGGHLASSLQNIAIPSIGALLAVALAVFIGYFFIPGWQLKRQLNSALKNIRETRAKREGNITDLPLLGQAAFKSGTLKHLWKEYCETLHPERDTDASGQTRLIRYRATTLAESYFTDQALVDTPLKTEFFKHLPGMLTGLGIIGTFSGLISGLSTFDVSRPERAALELDRLLQHVSSAFVISAIAITLAMLFTWIEKVVITRRYAQVEALRQFVDSLFNTGIGEEYLERLVRSSETAAVQAMHIKDALVADLKEVLSELTTRQINAIAEQASDISQNVGRAIVDNLGAPMAQMASAVDRVSADQGSAVTKLLTDVLSSFAAQMQDIFGGQMRGMSDLLSQTILAMQSTATKFEHLASNMDSAGRTAAAAMSEKLNEAVASMEVRQQQLNRQMSEFVTELQRSLATSQDQTGLKVQELLARLGDQMSTIVGGLEKQVRTSQEGYEQHANRMSAQAEQGMSQLSDKVTLLIEQSTRTNASLETSVRALSDATTSAISKMNDGAETLYLAASEFSKAGQGVTETIKAVLSAADKIAASSQALAASADAARTAVDEFKATRSAFAGMTADLRTTVEAAKREASVTSDLVNNLRLSADKLSAAHRDLEAYLDGVSDVLGRSHEAFAQNITTTLKQGNAEFHKELSTAVRLLSGGIQELSDTLDAVPSRQ
jgi:ABC-type transporter Mla subunit MlaD